LEEIAKDIVRFKNAHRKVVDKHGVITKLAERSGIPQPSLSRYFSSASLPRRATLYEINEALSLNQKEIVNELVA
jgi:DNA-binding phage protein